jgi:nicotinamidase-related amidase
MTGAATLMERSTALTSERIQSILAEIRGGSVAVAFKQIAVWAHTLADMFRASPAKEDAMEPLATNAALMIIDMQQGMNQPALGRRNNPDAELQMQRLLSVWRQATRPIVHVRHISRTPGSVFWPGQPGCEFQAPLLPLAHEHVVEKNVPDAFAHTGLERWLHVRSIKQLVIVGVITNNSVEATARSGGNLGFDVIVASDACYTFDQTDLSGRLWLAQDVHALSLSNLAMDYARVAGTDEILASA